MSLQLSPEQVKKTLSPKNSESSRSPYGRRVEQQETADAGTMSGCEVSPEIARQSAADRQSATVMVYSGEKAKE